MLIWLLIRLLCRIGIATVSAMVVGSIPTTSFGAESEILFAYTVIRGARREAYKIMNKTP